MTSGQKTAFSFLSALLIFGAFVIFAQTGLMSKIETKFYAQSRIAQKQSQVDKLSESCNSYISDIFSKIQDGDSAFLKAPSVKSFVQQNPSEKDEIDRRNLTIKLLDELDGLEGIRLIENNGRNIHFSTFESDVMKVDGLKKQYKNYPDVQAELKEFDSSVVLVNQNAPESKIILDSNANRIIISFPFYITEKTCFASLVCYFNQYSLEQLLINKQELSIGENFLIACDDSYKGGFIADVPLDGKKEFLQAAVKVWSKKSESKNQVERILEGKDNSYWVMMTGTSGKFINVSAAVNSSYFELPKEYIWLIYISVFITILLIAFLIFSLKRDYLTVIKQRVKKVQFGMINEYLENKQKVEWASIARQLEFRKEEFSDEIKKSIGGKSKKHEKEINEFLDKSWEEIISVINSQKEKETGSLNGASIEEIRRVIEEVLQTAKINVNNVVPQTQGVTPVEEVSDVEEISDAEEIEEIEEIGEAEEISDAEEIPEAEAVEEIEEVEEIADAEEVSGVEEIAEAEEIAEVEPEEEISDVEEISPADKTVVQNAPQADETIAIEAEEAEEVSDADDAHKESEELEDIDINIVEEAEPEDSETAVDIPDVNIDEEKELELAAVKVKMEAQEFSATDDAFTEEPGIGTAHPSRDSVPYDDSYRFVVYIPDFCEPDELLPAGENNFSLTSFGADGVPVTELEGESPESIVQDKGVYSISSELEYSNVKLDPVFKELVDSVIKN